MRDPAVNPQVEAAIAEAMRFLEAHKSWLKPTRIDWSDVHLRAEAALSLGRLRLRTESGVMLEFRPASELNLRADVRDLLVAEVVKLKPLSRGKGRYQKGMYGPRDKAIVQAIKHITERYGFPAIGGQQKTKKPTAAFIARIALKRMGVTLRQRTIEDIWSSRLRSNSPN